MKRTERTINDAANTPIYVARTPRCMGCGQAPATRELLKKGTHEPFDPPQLICEPGAKAWGFQDTRPLTTPAAGRSIPAARVGDALQTGISIGPPASESPAALRRSTPAETRGQTTGGGLESPSPATSDHAVRFFQAGDDDELCGECMKPLERSPEGWRHRS